MLGWVLALIGAVVLLIIMACINEASKEDERVERLYEKKRDRWEL